MKQPNKTTGGVHRAADEKLDVLGHKLARAARYHGRVTTLMTRGRMTHAKYEDERQRIKKTCYQTWIEFGQLIWQRRWFETDL